MNLLEHESKTLLAAHNIPVPASQIINQNTTASLPLPVILKSQVPTGGRGKAGGIRFVDTPEALALTAAELFELPIKGHLPKALLAEEKLSIARELYLSLLVDRASQGLKLVAHKNGGVEVEDNKDFASWQVEYDKPDFDALGQALADTYDLQGHAFALQDMVQNLFTCLKANDATLIEINPLVVTTKHTLVAGDAKITLDDNAAFRHPEWQFAAKATEANFVTINQEGTVATIANGAGLAMATVDAVSAAGLEPANFLDIGGGATKETLLAAFERIQTYPNVSAILINIFAGITQADEVARAIIAAKQQISGLAPLAIRIAGTNAEAARALLAAENIPLLESLEDCIATIQEASHA